VNVICLDKTGTLTEGRIVLKAISDGVLEEPLSRLELVPREILAAALRASPDPELFPDHDPTDDALYRGAASFAMRPSFGLPAWTPRSELSFEAGRSYHATLGRVSENTHRLSIKGAPEAVLPLCTTWRRAGSLTTLDGAARDQLSAEVAQLGRRGLRVLAVAERALDEDLGVLAPEKLVALEFLGFLVFTDPVRPSARTAIEGLSRAGVRTVMVTGDHPSTAQAIANELLFAGQERTLSGPQLSDLDDNQLDEVVNDIAVFARITPAQKVRIVRSLQRTGRVVAMAGDGANDAPAIRLADVGVAIGEHSTAAARSAADVVLTDGKIETLVAAIAEGRAMWARVRDAVSILLGGNFGEIGFTTLVGVLSGRPPLSARQLLLVNLLTDVAPAMAIALRPPTQATLDQMSLAGPETTLGKPLTREIALRAALTSAGAGSAWMIARVTGGRDRARTVALAALVGTQLAQTLRSGQGSRGVVATSAASAAVLAAIIQTPGVSHFFGCRPLGPIGWATAIGASVAAASIPRLSESLSEWVGEKEPASVDVARVSRSPGRLNAAASVGEPDASVG
jgi:cation-transporting ATPase I